MAEEFEESEVVFQEAKAKEEERDGEKAKRNLKTSENTSVPVGIRIPDRNTWLRRVGYDLDGGEQSELVPPHVVLGRRKMTSLSVCTGNGRTLKGRDLNQVRNSILRLTGFLE